MSMSQWMDSSLEGATQVRRAEVGEFMFAQIYKIQRFYQNPGSPLLTDSLAQEAVHSVMLCCRYFIYQNKDARLVSVSEAGVLFIYCL